MQILYSFSHCFTKPKETPLTQILRIIAEAAAACAQVLFLDPAHQQTVELVKLSELFYKHMIPLRYVPEAPGSTRIMCPQPAQALSPRRHQAAALTSSG